MTTSKGRRLENDTATELARETSDEVNVWPAGYSGSNAYACPDIAITAPGNVYAIEMKTTSSDDYLYVDEDDCRQLLDCRNDYTEASLFVSWSRREPVLFQIRYGQEHLLFEASPAEIIAEHVDEVFDPHVTDSGSLRLSKPSLDEWPSATSGRDVVDVLVDELSLPT